MKKIVKLHDLPVEQRRKLLMHLTTAAEKSKNELGSLGLFLAGIGLGIVGTLFADVIDAFVRGGDPYPAWYVVIVGTLLAGLALLGVLRYRKMQRQLVRTRQIIEEIKKTV